MGINGANIRVNTLGRAETTPTPPETPPPQADPLDEQREEDVVNWFEHAFDGPSETTENFSNSENAIDDYFTYKGANDGFKDWITNFPPTVGEIAANVKNFDRQPDLALPFYERADKKLQGLLDSYNELAGTITAGLLERKQLVQEALAKCRTEKGKIQKSIERLNRDRVIEMQQMKDINGDGVIGKFGDPGALLVVYKNGKELHVDPTTGRAVRASPSVESRLTTNNSLLVAPNTDPKIGLTLQINPVALTAGPQNNPFNTMVDFSIPEYITVKRDKDGQPKPKFEAGKPTYDISANWAADTNGGISSPPPTDLNKEMQVLVTKFEIHSVSGDYKDGTNSLNEHEIWLYHGEDIITKIKIVGTEVQSQIPQSVRATKSDGTSVFYSAAAMNSISINGDNRITPVEGSAENMRSQVRHIVNNFEGALGITDPMNGINPNDLQRARDAYNANKGAFAFNGATGYDTSKYGTSGVTDVYVPDDVPTSVAGDTALALRTGIIMRNLAGKFTGTSYNDLFQIRSPNDRHAPDDTSPVLREDPFWTSMVDAKGGTNIVVTGKQGENPTNGGDYIIRSATFVISNAGDDGDNYVSTPSLELPDDGGKPTISNVKNPHVFVKLSGKTNYIDNPGEVGTAGDILGADSKAAIDQARPSYNDDYFLVVKGGAKFNVKEDADIAKQIKNNAALGAFLEHDGGIQEQQDKRYKEWLDEINREEKVEEADYKVALEEMGEEEKATAEELNSFFNLFDDKPSEGEE